MAHRCLHRGRIRLPLRVPAADPSGARAVREALQRLDLPDALSSDVLKDVRLPGLPGPVTLPVSLSIALPDVPRRARISTAPIVVTRATLEQPHEYDVVVRVAPPFTLRVSLLTGDGRSAQVSQAVRAGS